MKIWVDRLVGPDGLVVMPEDVAALFITAQKVILKRGDRVDISGARRDRCTDMPDKAGVVIYERDRVRDVDNGRIYTVFAMPTGEWRMMSQYGKDVSLCHADVEVIGMEPYGEVDHV